jgi:pyrroloquinoline-quinone synthase
MSDSTVVSRFVHITDRFRERRHKMNVSVQEWFTGKRGVNLSHTQTYEPLPYEDNPRVFLAHLRHAVETHVGVNHPLLGRVAHVPFTREDYLVMGLQHYPLVGTFTTYLELLLLRAPHSDAKQWIAKVLIDEYGEGSDDKDHAELYQEFLVACGASEAQMTQTMLHEEITSFIADHLHLCSEEPFLVGLGAVGPGHEWAIPKMFPQIVKGLRRAGFDEKEILYFTLHMEQDEDHGAWLEEALVDYATTPEAQAQIHQGAMRSLAARTRFWTGVQDKIVRWRQPKNVHLRSQMRRDGDRQGREMTLEGWRGKISEHGLLAATRI